MKDGPLIEKSNRLSREGLFIMLNSVHIPLSFQEIFPSLGVFYRECTPDVLLSSYIAYYWILRTGDVDYPVKSTPPDGGTDIIIDMDNPVNPVLYGQSASYFTVPEGRRHNIFGIRLKPGAAFHLLSVPASEFMDTAIPLSLLLSKHALKEYTLALEMERITKEVCFSIMIKAIERWLSILICSIQAKDSGVGNILDLIGRMNISTSIDTIAYTLSLSPRQLERVFKKIYGLTPKSFLRINRFQSVLARKNMSDDISWCDISQIHGYYDQSHLCNEFKEFTGMAPREYFGHHLL